MKYADNEKVLLKVKDGKEYYSLLNEICVNDLDNMDMCKKIIKKSFTKKLSQNDEVKLKNKIKQVFQRNSANLDGDDSLTKWLEYIDVDIKIVDNKIILN